MNAADRLRFEQQRQYFEQAFARLEEVLALDEDEVVRDALIQRFEFTFEMAWKVLYRFLVGQGERVAEKAWDVLPLAFQAMLITDAQTWDQLRAYRNDTSHEYNRAKAVEVAAFVRSAGHAALLSLRNEMSRR